MGNDNRPFRSGLAAAAGRHGSGTGGRLSMREIEAALEMGPTGVSQRCRQSLGYPPPHNPLPPTNPAYLAHIEAQASQLDAAPSHVASPAYNPSLNLAYASAVDPQHYPTPPSLNPQFRPNYSEYMPSYSAPVPPANVDTAPSSTGLYPNLSSFYAPDFVNEQLPRTTVSLLDLMRVYAANSANPAAVDSITFVQASIESLKGTPDNIDREQWLTQLIREIQADRQKTLLYSLMAAQLLATALLVSGVVLFASAFPMGALAVIAIGEAFLAAVLINLGKDLHGHGEKHVVKCGLLAAVMIIGFTVSLIAGFDPGTVFFGSNFIFGFLTFLSSVKSDSNHFEPKVNAAPEVNASCKKLLLTSINRGALTVPLSRSASLNDVVKKAMNLPLNGDDIQAARRPH